MERNPHPQTVYERERDDQLFGPRSLEEDLRLDRELSRTALVRAHLHAAASAALLRRAEETLARSVAGRFRQSARQEDQKPPR